jgi:predicted Zn-dependent protease
MKILLITFSICVLCNSAALAEYNPATGEDDIVLIGEAKEVRMGRSLSKNVEKKFGIVKDAGVQMRVGGIGQRVAKVCDRPNLAYSFIVLEGKKLKEEQRYNAFALPGGYVYIFRDMVEDMQSDDELAAILAHEVAHVVAKHGIKKLQGSLGMAALQVLGSMTAEDRHTKAKSSVAITELMMAHNRQAEFEADKLSIQYLEEAGFDPKAAVTVIDRMLEKQLKGKVRRYRYFNTHPHASERKAMLNKEIEGEFSFDDYINVRMEPGTPF